MFGVVKLLLLAIAEGVALEDVVGLQTSGSHGTKESDAKLQKVVKQTDRGAAKTREALLFTELLSDSEERSRKKKLSVDAQYSYCAGGQPEPHRLNCDPQISGLLGPWPILQHS